MHTWELRNVFLLFLKKYSQIEGIRLTADVLQKNLASSVTVLLYFCHAK